MLLPLNGHSDFSVGMWCALAHHIPTFNILNTFQNYLYEIFSYNIIIIILCLFKEFR
jgi:hypothetical protein